MTGEVVYSTYQHEYEIDDIQKLISVDLSEPYSVFTFRYFIYNWPNLCYIAKIDGEMIGAIVCKLEMRQRKGVSRYRGYIAMLAVKEEHRHRKIGTILSRFALDRMQELGADECVLETEVTNGASLGLYRTLGFIKVKRLHKYYLNGVDAFRLKRMFRDEQNFDTIITPAQQLQKLMEENLAIKAAKEQQEKEIQALEKEYEEATTA